MTAPHKYWFTSSSGEIEIQLTQRQAEDMCHCGDCTADVQQHLQDPEIQAMLNEIKPEVLARVLSEYADWDVSDHEENKERILWLAAGDIFERGYSGLLHFSEIDPEAQEFVIDQCLEDCDHKYTPDDIPTEIPRSVIKETLEASDNKYTFEGELIVCN